MGNPKRETLASLREKLATYETVATKLVSARDETIKELRESNAHAVSWRDEQIVKLRDRIRLLERTIASNSDYVNDNNHRWSAQLNDASRIFVELVNACHEAADTGTGVRWESAVQAIRRLREEYEAILSRKDEWLKRALESDARVIAAVNGR